MGGNLRGISEVTLETFERNFQTKYGINLDKSSKINPGNSLGEIPGTVNEKVSQ